MTSLFSLLNSHYNNKIQDVISQLREDQNSKITLKNKDRDEQYVLIYCHICPLMSDFLSLIQIQSKYTDTMYGQCSACQTCFL